MLALWHRFGMDERDDKEDWKAKAGAAARAAARAALGGWRTGRIFDFFLAARAINSAFPYHSTSTSMSFTYIGGSGIDESLEAKAVALSRQLAALVSQVEDGASSSSSSSTDLDESDLFARVGALASETASQALRKTSLRATTLASRGAASGFQLALAMARQIPWTTLSGDEGVLPRHAHDWLSAALSYLAGNGSDAEVLRPLLELVTKHIFSPATSSRPEYSRHVVSPNLPKLPALLAARLERRNRAELPVLLDVVADELEVRANTYRPVAARLHACASAHAADEAQHLRLPALRLLGQLHLTGAVGERVRETSSAHLWSATSKAAIGSARAAFQDSTTTYARRQITPQAQLSIQGTPLERLAISVDIVAALLSLPTQRAVPVPLSRLFSLCHDMLIVSRAKPSIEVDVHVREAAVLVRLRLLALRLLVIILETARVIGQDAVARFASPALEDAVALLEDVDEAPAVRASAASVLAVQVSLDPSSRLVLRASRACLGALVPRNEPTRPQKRTRGRYESDSVAAGSSSSSGRRVYAPLSQACLAALPHFFAHLSTSLTPAHFDSAHTMAQVVVALGAPAVDCLAQLVEICPAGSPLLGLLTPRLSQLANHSARAQEVLRNVLMPRLPPVLPGRHDADETEDLGQRDWGIDASTGREVVAKTGRVLGGDLAVDAALEAVGLREPVVAGEEASATAEVTMEEAAPPTTAASPPLPPAPAARRQSPVAPRHSSPAALSPEPVKPLRRPTTPKLGSPTAKAVGTAMSPEAKEIFAAPAPARQQPAQTSAPATTTTTAAVVLAEDSDDEELPEIDLRSDDDDDEA